MPGRIIATSFALIAFAAAIICGVAADNTASTIIWRAILVMLGAYMVGRAVGWAAERAIAEHVEHYKQANPVQSNEPRGAPAGEPIELADGTNVDILDDEETATGPSSPAARSDAA
jgi:hypothetical protein